MTQELYINGERCDLYDKEPIPLIFDSPFFTDINKIVSNRTYAIKIPKTPNNLKIIKFSHRTDNDNKFPYKRHIADYYLNGMEIIRDGSVILWSIAEDIEIQLIWGNISAFKELTDMNSLREIYTPSNLPVGDLKPDADEAVLLWPKENGEFWSGTNKEDRPGPYYWAKIDYGVGSIIKKNPNDPNEKGVGMEYFRPVVTGGWILDRLAEYKKIKFEMPSTTRQAIDNLVFPLFSKNASNTFWLWHTASGEIDEIAAKKELDSEVGNNEFMVKLDKNSEIAGSVVGEFVDFPSFTGFYTGYECLQNGRCHIKAQIKLQRYFCSELTLEVVKNGRVCFSQKAELIDGVHIIDLNYIEPVTNQDDFRFRLILKDYIKGNGANFLQKSFQMVVEPSGPEVELGSYYPILPNLPDISPAAFLKLLMQITGTFPYVREKHSDTIRFTSIDSLYQNVKMRNAVDWTNKVLMHSRYSNDPSQMEFKYGSYAQKNRCLWKEDKKVEVDASGYLMVESEHLEKEKDLLKLELTATDMKDGVAIIPMFTMESDGKIKENEVKTRVLVNGIKLLDGLYRSIPYFEKGKGYKDEDFQLLFDGDAGILKQFYSNYQNIIRTPKVIQVKCLLNEYDISILDLTVPIYFEQFGQYYVILKIQSNNGVSDCELLEIDEPIV